MSAKPGEGPLPPSAVSEKLRSYEAFLNDKLRVDLKCGFKAEAERMRSG